MDGWLEAQPYREKPVFVSTTPPNGGKSKARYATENNKRSLLAVNDGKGDDSMSDGEDIESPAIVRSKAKVTRPVATSRSSSARPLLLLSRPTANARKARKVGPGVHGMSVCTFIARATTTNQQSFLYCRVRIPYSVVTNTQLNYCYF
jgi:hypothetical protein